MNQRNNPDAAMSFVSDSSFMIPDWVPALSAWHGHGPFAFWIIGIHRPRCLVELGTHLGFSYMAFCQCLARNRIDGKCYAVDTWKGDEHAGFYEEEVFAAVQEHNRRCYANFSTLIRASFDEALPQFPDGSIDLLHIDGLHTYEATRHNFNTWLPKMSERGVVLFHDTNERGRDFGVFQVWQELATLYPHFEFFHGHGLGVLGVGKNLPQPLKELFSCGEHPATAGRIRAAYSRLGGSIAHDAEMERRLLESAKALESQALEIADKQRIIKSLRAVEKLAARSEEQIHDLEERLQQENARFIRAMESVEFWQRSWFRRAFQRWHLVREYSRAGLPRRLERSIRKFRKKLLTPFLGGEEGCAEDAPAPDDYQQWVQRHDTLDDAARGAIRDRIATLQDPPLISVVMPTYNTKAEWLARAIESVQNQLYPHWELCIAEDASTQQNVRQMLERYRCGDERIRVVYREATGHISRASNSAIAIARGTYVALLDHDDVLAEHALAYVALAASKHPDAQILYSDEDKLSPEGLRVQPHFKSDWNPDLFYSQNYVCHLSVFRRDLLAKIRGFRVGVEGSQDQDLLLRCLTHVAGGQIIHIPHILYHWRIVPGSTALEPDGKDYTTEAGLKALNDHFDENGPQGVRVERGDGPNTYRVRWPLPSPAPLVSLLIPTRDRLELIKTATYSILDKTSYRNFEILIVDNGSVENGVSDFYKEIQAEDSRVRVLSCDGPFNFSAINNSGVAQAKGSILGFINNDIEVINRDWLGEMVAHASRRDIGCVGAKLYYSDGRIQHSGVIVGLGGVAGHSHKHFPRKHPGYFSRLLLTQSLSAVTAACMLVRREVFEQAGGFDEANLPVAFNDVDFCLKVREMGYRNIWTPYAGLYHHESLSRGSENSPEKRARFESEVRFMREKWGPLLDKDPFYNPNLTLDHENFGLSHIPPHTEDFIRSML